ncbi:Hok/Gef family protein [Escherichia coli]|uniref:Hok/Gef family protein n=1 Tax=Escherichia coli TaxID=562 RepID=UPI001C176DD4|nr:Hok/Gef family protein [Escherichia coli]EKK7365890.1 type I toxin-antitoxin system Hok family toxin [Escherichia coli]HBE5492545.1 type I toxin-antitoxin system Hok family toxin [Escherichia coli]
MKQQKAMLITLIVICLTVVIVTVLVTRKDLCEVRIRTDQTEVAVFTAYELGE